MNNIEFIDFVDNAIRVEMLLGPDRDERRLQGLRNIKSDFNYIVSKDSKMTTLDVLIKMFKEREENENIYKQANNTELWLQEHVEAGILKRWIPNQPSNDEIFSYLGTLDLPKQKSSFKKFQDACSLKFGQKVDSNIILNFIEQK